MAPVRRVVTSSLFRRRNLHTSPQPQASVLFALGALSNSRETQHFNKISRLERVEHSPPLKLIKTSEVDPFPLPEPSKAVPTRPRESLQPLVSQQIWNQKALAIGRVALANNARETAKLRRALEKVKRRDAQRTEMMQREMAEWAKERQRMRNEMRSAGAWILVSVGTATGLAMWRFWPQKDVANNSADMSGRLAASISSAVPLPASISKSATAVASPPAMTAAASETLPATTPVVSLEKATIEPALRHDKQSSSWWKGLFWKQ